MRYYRAILVAILLIVFVLPEMLIWAKADDFKSPLRYFKGDTAHYTAILHRAQVDGGPGVNAYFKEEADEPSQFVVFGSIIGLMHPFIRDLNIVWLSLVLKVATILLVFYLLSKLLHIFGASRVVAHIFSFAFILFYGPASFQGYALGFWFLPFFLGSLLLATEFFLKEFNGSKDLVRPILAIGLAAVHPVYFALMGLFILILWILKVKNEKNLWRYGALWLVVAGVIFFSLFSSFILGSGPASEETLYRIVAVNMRLPIHWLYTFRLGLLAAIGLLLYRRGRDNRWFVVSALSLATIVGINSYLITGKYIVNDHYGITEDFIVMLALSLYLFTEARIRSRWLPVVGISVLAISVFTILDYLHFRPGYYGKWLPLHAGYLVLFASMLRDEVKGALNQILRKRVFVIGLLILVPFLYASALTYKETQSEMSLQLNTARHREVVEYLNTLPPGVVLANPVLSELLADFTQDKVYWSMVGFSETALNSELVTRWSKTREVFRNDPYLSGPAAQGSVVGTMNRCSDFGRHRAIEITTFLGWEAPEHILCGPLGERKARFKLLEEEADKELARDEKSASWDPKYEVDYLVVTSSDQVPPWIYKYFTLIKNLGESRIYKFKTRPSA